MLMYTVIRLHMRWLCGCLSFELDCDAFWDIDFICFGDSCLFADIWLIFDMGDFGSCSFRDTGLVADVEGLSSIILTLSLVSVSELSPPPPPRRLNSSSNAFTSSTSLSSISQRHDSIFSFKLIGGLRAVIVANLRSKESDGKVFFNKDDRDAYFPPFMCCWGFEGEVAGNSLGDSGLHLLLPGDSGASSITSLGEATRIAIPISSNRSKTLVLNKRTPQLISKPTPPGLTTESGSSMSKAAMFPIYENSRDD
uniref:Uncharacterized protein n=1 Tax=Glossina palpalis gambiensis TaxID=67801 RepID=A0A1B0BZ17_9MUSC